MKPKVIILEGPDGAGKTTLADSLVADGYYYMHHGLYDDDPEQLFRRYARSIILAHRMGRNVVIDRCYLSEAAYGPVMRSNDRLGMQRRYLLHRLCQGLGVLEIICLPPYGVVENNWRNKKNDYTSDAQRLLAIYRLYDSFLGDDSYHRFDYARGACDLEAPPRLPEGAIGSSNAKFLIVGEQPNKRLTTVDIPFFAVTGSSGFLNACLQEAGISEQDIAITNAVPIRHTVTTSGWRANSGARDLQNVVHHLPNFRHAIALGKVAARELKRQGVPHVALPHPSYWKRFRASQKSEYVQLLKGAFNANTFVQFLQCLAPAVMDSDAAGNGVGSSGKAHKRTPWNKRGRDRFQEKHNSRPATRSQLPLHGSGVALDSRGKKRRPNRSEV